LEDAGLKDGVNVFIGETPVSQKFAEDIHADAYGASALQGEELIKTWLGEAA
jgi:methanogenic corrinoid protein MtbC1